MTGFNGIVVGVNTLEVSRAAIGWAVAEAEARHVPVRLVHAMRSWAVPEPALLGGAYAWPDPPLDVLRQAAAETLHHAETYARSLAPQLKIEAEVHEGDPSHVLRQAADAAALIVIGSRNLGAIRSALFGSTGVGLAHGSGTPFVVVRGDQPTPANSPVVVGVDPKETCEPVLAAAFEYAATHERALRALMCWEPFFYAPHDRFHAGADDIRNEADLWLAEALAGWQETYPEVTVQRELVFEYPTSALIDASLTADLVVVGVSGKHVSRMLGSVAMGVLHHAGCPVEVIPR